MRTPVGLVLAAGAGRRFGGPKAELVIAGERLVDRAVGILRDGGVEDVIVITNSTDLDVPSARQVLVNEAAMTGMGSSLRSGLLAADHLGAGAAVILLVDQPLVAPEAVSLLVAAADGPGCLVQASYGGRRGHPVLIGSAHFAAVADGAEGDEGARRYLERAHRSGRLAIVETPGDPRDIDTPDDAMAIELLLSR